jgi:hypothetical protein
MSAHPIQRWKCVCAYDGGDFSGWQSQPDGHAVQDVIERRLRWMFGRAVRIHGSGRTDAGVHALGQVPGRSVSPPVLLVNPPEARRRGDADGGAAPPWAA